MTEPQSKQERPKLDRDVKVAMAKTLNRLALLMVGEVAIWAVLLWVLGLALRVGFHVTFPFASVLILAYVGTVALKQLIRSFGKAWHASAKAPRVIVQGGEAHEVDPFEAVLLREVMKDIKTAPRGADGGRVGPYL